MALGGRGAVSPNPKAASQDLKCFSSVGPRLLGHTRNKAELPSWRSAPVLLCFSQEQGCCARAGELAGGWGCFRNV